jgi:8-amino-7-oxononanoate synthase
VIDFTSALYLGMRHESCQLSPWCQLTTGYPAALAEPPEVGRVAEDLARLQGCEQSTFGVSTLHLFWDLFGLLSRRTVVIYMDDGLYPIGRWGVERAAARGLPVFRFPHHDAEKLRRILRRTARAKVRPVIVTDGFCPGRGKPAPLTAYLDCARSLGGYLVIDDTQALGIFGQGPNLEHPYGHGGGGMLRAVGINDANVVVISSLAKGFGVPIGALSGSKSIVSNFENRSETRVHCSPPSTAHLRAVTHALEINNDQGDVLRSRLVRLIRHFKTRLASLGLTTRGIFPVQTLAAPDDLDVTGLHERLLELGIKTVLHRNGLLREKARLSFVITTLHSLRQIDMALSALAAALQCNSQNCSLSSEVAGSALRGQS